MICKRVEAILWDSFIGMKETVLSFITIIILMVSLSLSLSLSFWLIFFFNLVVIRSQRRTMLIMFWWKVSQSTISFEWGRKKNISYRRDCKVNWDDEVPLSHSPTSLVLLFSFPVFSFYPISFSFFLSFSLSVPFSLFFSFLFASIRSLQIERNESALRQEGERRRRRRRRRRNKKRSEWRKETAGNRTDPWESPENPENGERMSLKSCRSFCRVLKVS